MSITSSSVFKNTYAMPNAVQHCGLDFEGTTLKYKCECGLCGELYGFLVSRTPRGVEKLILSFLISGNQFHELEGPCALFLIKTIDYTLGTVASLVADDDAFMLNALTQRMPFSVTHLVRRYNQTYRSEVVDVFYEFVFVEIFAQNFLDDEGKWYLLDAVVEHDREMRAVHPSYGGSGARFFENSKEVVMNIFLNMFKKRMLVRAAIMAHLLVRVEATNIGQAFDNLYGYSFDIIYGFEEFLRWYLTVLSLSSCELMRLVTLLESQIPVKAYEIGLIMITIFLIVRISKWWLRPRMRIVLANKTNAGQAIEAVAMSRNSNGLEITLRGPEGNYTVPMNTTENTSVVSEMAITGSEFSVAKFRPGMGAILVEKDEGKIVLVAHFFRYGSYFITADHVAKSLASCVDKVWVAPPVTDLQKRTTINERKAHLLPENFFENNLVSMKAIDVFITRLDSAVWAKLGIQALKTDTMSQYNMQVSTVGFIDGLLTTATGTTKKTENQAFLDHTASTRKGFSGSPVFYGKKLVGMHISGSPGMNQMVRIEFVLRGFEKEVEAAVLTSSTPSFERTEDDYKVHGESTYRDNAEGHDLLVTNSGKVYFRDQFIMSSRPLEEQWGAMDDETPFDFETDEQYKLRISKQAYTAYYEDESVEVNKPECLERVGKRNKSHVREYPPNQELATHLVEEFKPQAEKLGYVEGELLPIKMTAQNEKKSLFNHIKLFESRVKAIRYPPSKVEIERTINTMERMMSADRYIPPSDYRTKEHILRIINSSDVKGAKSAGQPFIEMGLPLNSDVLVAWGAEGLADYVLAKWDEPCVLRPMMKAEPHSKKKVDAEMPRIVIGLPLHKLIKHNAISAAFQTSCIANWKDSPIKFNLSPIVPGHAKHAWEWMKNGQVVVSDKPTWDYSFFKYLVDINEEIHKRMAIKPAQWTDEQMQAYYEDIESMYTEVFRDNTYHLSTGELYKKTIEGIMKSGYFGTIKDNSIAQLAVHVLTAHRCLLTENQVCSEDYRLMTGGDDVNNKFPVEFNVVSYFSEMSDLGIEVKDYEVLINQQHMEFYSTVFEKKDGVITFKPLRFNKLIEKLKFAKDENIAGSLISHMNNHLWDSRKFHLFKAMWERLVELRPDLVQVSDFRSQKYLQAKNLGYEMAD